MKILKPKKLQKNDVIGIISPASSPVDLSRIEKGVHYFERLGYRVEVGKNVGKERGYLAGEDSERLDDLHEMFKNKFVKAIFCLRGGYGSARLIDKINFKVVRDNPKIFVGYSDITSLQLAFFSQTGLITFAGPMVAVDFWQDEINQFTEENFWKIITSNKKVGKLVNPNGEKFFILSKGNASGRILGGNLALLTSMMGTKYLPKFKNSILMIEDIGEPPYRIDRFLNQLKLANILRDVSGVILGRFVDCYENDSSKKSLTLNQVIIDYLENLKKPVIYNFKHGHIAENLSIPFGLKCHLNASRGFVEIPENAVV